MIKVQCCNLVSEAGKDPLQAFDQSSDTVTTGPQPFEALRIEATERYGSNEPDSVSQYTVLYSLYGS